jgi:hypothetical protein
MQMAWSNRAAFVPASQELPRARGCCLALLAALLVLAAPARAETCKYVDSQGRVTYSNAPVRGAKKITCFQPPSAPIAPPAAQVDRQSDGASADGDSHRRSRVDTQTQRRRDNDRIGILEQELAGEQEALAQAKRALAEQEAVRYGDERNYERVLERLKPYQDMVAQHEKNIASIQQELAGLR